MRHRRHRRDVGHFGQRIGRCLQKEQLRLRLHGGFPFADIGGGDKSRLHAELFQDAAEQIDRRAEDTARGDDVVAAFQQPHATGQNRRHAGSCRHALFRALHGSQTLLEHGDGGIGEARVDVARLFADEEQGRYGQVEQQGNIALLFIGEEPGNIYSRFTNPTVTMFEERLAALEGAEQCVATASGMSAILACGMGLLKSGDHIVASRSIFGSTVNLFGTIFKRFGVETTFVSATDVGAWEAAVKPQTRLFFLETPSNPLTEISDIAALAAVAHKHGALLAVDNCFCTPVLQRPLELGADIVIHSATKYIDGQGRVLGGAVLGNRKTMEGVYQFLRTAGPTMSAFNAWVFLKGLETLKLRMDAHSANALQLARWLETQPECGARVLPRLAFPSAACAGDEAAEERRRHRFIRSEGWQGSRMARGG